MNAFTGKTALVTGATGFIGGHLVSRLRSESGIRLVLLSRRPPQKAAAGATWVTASLDGLTAETWRAAGVDHVHLVFHLGAFTPKTAGAADQVAEVYRDNLLGTRALLESLPGSPERIVFSSTLDVYAPPEEGAVLNEDSPVGPISLYGTSKLFCEQLIRVYARSHRCGYAILRYGHIFGPGEEDYGKLIPQTIRQLLRGEAPIVYGDGRVERDFLHVADAVEATLRAACSEVRELEPVNVIRGVSCPIREVIEILIRITGFPGEIRFLSERSGGRSLCFDNRRMRLLLGEWPLVSLEDGLREEVAHFRRLSLS